MSFGYKCGILCSKAAHNVTILVKLELNLGLKKSGLIQLFRLKNLDYQVPLEPVRDALLKLGDRRRRRHWRFIFTFLALRRRTLSHRDAFLCQFRPEVLRKMKQNTQKSWWGRSDDWKMIKISLVIYFSSALRRKATFATDWQELSQPKGWCKHPTTTEIE